MTSTNCNKQINKNKPIDTESRAVVTRGKGKRGRAKRVKEVNCTVMDRTKLLVMSMLQCIEKQKYNVADMKFT